MALAVARERWEASHTLDEERWRSLLPAFAKITREVVHRGPFMLLLPRPDEKATDEQTFFLSALLNRSKGDPKSSSAGPHAHKSTEL